MPDLQGYINTGFENINANIPTAFSTLGISLNSLANNACHCSSGYVTSQSYLPALSPAGNTMAPLDFGVVFKIKTGTVSGGSPLVNIYIVGSNDGGVTWTSGVILNDSVLTLPPDVAQFWKFGTIYTPNSAQVYESNMLSVKNIFGGVPPTAWGFIVENKTGGALDATAGGSISYQMAVGTFF